MAIYKCSSCDNGMPCIFDTGASYLGPDWCPYSRCPVPGVRAPTWEQIRKPTGIKDKNGNEISEGDIVEITSFGKSYKCEVIWDNYRWGGKGFWFSHFDNPSDMFSQGTKNIEIIGNIHQNAERLKGG